MNKRLYNHLTEEDQLDFKRRLNENADLLLRVSEIARDKLNEEHIKSIKASNYELPAWSEKQADSIGYQRALADLIEIITL